MDISNQSILTNMLIENEGLKQFPYFDCCGKFFRQCKCEKQGKLTVSIGRNLEDVGISKEESLYLLKNDINSTINDAVQFQWFRALDQVRQIVIMNMMFNLGLPKFLGFKRLIAALQKNNYEQAAIEMLASDWSAQVGKRALKLSNIMKTGVLI